MKQENSFKKTAVICIIAGVIVIAALIAFLIVRNGAKPVVEPLIKYTVSETTDDSDGEESKVLVFTDENGKSLSVDGEDYMANLAQDRFIIVKNLELVYFQNEEMLPLSKNCISCTISNDGSLVGYIEPNSSEKPYVGTLYTYNTITGEKEQICDTCFVSMTGRIQISPSGDTVAYVKDYNESDYTYDCCYYNGKKETVIGQNRDILAISDNAEYIYYAIEDPEAYTSVFAVYTKDKGEVILDEAAKNRMYLNKDYSECVYYMGDDDEKLYISRKGSEGVLYKENAAELDTSSLVPHVNAVLDFDTFE